MKEFSVLMSVYKNTKADELAQCMDSLFNQTAKASQYVLVIDGPVSDELKNEIEKLKNRTDELEVVPFETNQGLGIALCEGMKHCKYELIARMDTDDIAVLDRFEKQLACFEKDENLSICGGNMAEFQKTVDNITSHRIVPEKHEDICNFLKSRCPFNHMTVMFKKSEVERAGGYLDWYHNEDSYLWVRMYLAGCKFYNLQDILVYARIDDQTFRRRGGRKYYRSERDLFKFMRKNKIISLNKYNKERFKRYIVYVLMTNRMREWAFKKFVRE